MKRLLILILSAIALPVLAASGPIRVLYVGKEGTPATRPAHVLLREFGRDAIWFDYTTEAAVVTPACAVRTSTPRDKSARVMADGTWTSM